MNAQDVFVGHVLTLFTKVHNLDRVPRAGFLLRGVPEPESVSAHSHFIALLAMLFARATPDAYDSGKLLSMALIHDLAESQLMDIPMPVADAWLGEAKADAERGVFNALFQGFSGEYTALHEEFLACESPEARLLRALDKAQMMIKVMCYEREHRGCLDEFWGNPNNFNDYGIPAVSALFDALCSRAGKSRPQP